MNKLTNIHPGEVLAEEFLKPMGISAHKLSKELAISESRIRHVLKGEGRITTDTALRLSKYFGTSAKFWLGLQMDYDLEKELEELKSKLEKIKTIHTSRIA